MTLQRSTPRRRGDRRRPSTPLAVVALVVCAVVVAFLLIRSENGDLGGAARDDRPNASAASAGPNGSGSASGAGGPGGASQSAAGADLVDRLIESGAVAGALAADRGTASGGRHAPPTPLPASVVDAARAALATVPVRPSGSGSYDRAADFGDGWQDPDGNGCDARNDELAAAMTRISLAGDGCRVLSGTLDDPYTGRRIDFVRGPGTSDVVQIDHVVALANAWRTGASSLSAERRTDLANDPLNLQATDGPTNQGKSAKDASQWLPPSAAYRCTYVARQIAVKAVYGLWVTSAERDAMTAVLSAC